MNRFGMKVWALAGAAIALGGVAASPAGAAGYHSPGYKGQTSFGNARTPPLPAISLGTGKDPDLLVDAAGTAHVVFAQDGGSSAPDTLAFCNLQRGMKACASHGIAPNPVAPDSSQGGAYSGNIPSGNHDTDGPVPLAIGNQLYLIDRRYPDAFPTPDGNTSGSNVFEWSSTDGGATPTGPGQLGDNQMAGGAIAFGPTDSPSIGTISRSETGGTFFQGTAPGAYTTAKAQLGSGDQAYDGSLADDGTRPVAAFDDTSGHIFVREYSGNGDPNDAANWSTSTLSGYSPRIVGGPSGVFLLSSDSSINGGHLTLRKIVNGAATGAGVALGTSLTPPAISEDSSGDISFAYTDSDGIEVKTSTNGTTFGATQLAAAVSPTSIGHLVTASTGDGGGFVSYIKDGTGAEDVGQVLVSAFGTQQATHLPGLGPLPGGGIGSAAGDQLATSTCTTAGFGLVQALSLASCWAHVPANPNLDVSSGEVDINGLRIIPEAGVKIGIDPRLHTIDTTGTVRVVLSASNINITLFEGAIHAKIPTPDLGADLFDFSGPDFKDFSPDLEGFPIKGSIDFKLVPGGVQIPISLTMPAYFGGITGSTTLKASYPNKLDVQSVEFKIGDLNIAALELKNVDVSYTEASDTWIGKGRLLVPAGGGALDSTVSVTFQHGDFTAGSLDVSLPYPGLPLDPPELYLSHGGLGFNLHPVTLTGTMGLGFQPLLPPTKGGIRDFVFSLDGSLTASFGNPVTFTAQILGGYLYTIDIASAKLVYQVPDTVTLHAQTQVDLGFLRFTGSLDAVADPKHDLFGGQLDTDAFLKMPNPFSDVEIPSFSAAISSKGFGVYIPPPGIAMPIPPYDFVGTIGYTFGSDAHLIFKPLSDDTARFHITIPPAGATAAAAGTPFTVTKGAPTANLIVKGEGGAPTLQMTAPDGQTFPLDGKPHDGMKIAPLADAQDNTTFVGIADPKPGLWHVAAADGSAVPIASTSVAMGVSAPTVRGHLSGRGIHRTLRYQVKLPDGFAVQFAERTKKLMHRLGAAHGASGVIHFTPAAGTPGRRQVVALVTDADGLPNRTVTLGSFIATRPPKPGRARSLKVRAGRKNFTFSYRPPASAARVLITIVASDGRHLQRVVAASVRHGSVPVIGFKDAITVTVVGVSSDNRKGASVKASARNKR